MGQPQSFPVQTDRPFRLKSAQYWVVLDQDSRTYRLSLDESQAVTLVYSSLQYLEKGSVASPGIRGPGTLRVSLSCISQVTTTDSIPWVSGRTTVESKADKEDIGKLYENFDGFMKKQSPL